MVSPLEETSQYGGVWRCAFLGATDYLAPGKLDHAHYLARRWTALARVVRGRFLSLRAEGFVLPARVCGARQPRIISATCCRHSAAAPSVYGGPAGVSAAFQPPPAATYAVERCKTEPPTLRELRPDHFVNCHRAEELSLHGVRLRNRRYWRSKPRGCRKPLKRKSAKETVASREVDTLWQSRLAVPR
jgi:hypothetical protein